MPCEFSKPAGLIVALIEALTLLRKCVGFHPISDIFLIACAANFGIDRSTKTSASEAFRLTICESMVGSVVS
jgi:hypothetical protein